jgi:hypothetical protein
MYFVIEAGAQASAMHGASWGCIVRRRRRLVVRTGAGRGESMVRGVVVSWAAMVPGWAGVDLNCAATSSFAIVIAGSGVSGS